MKKRYHTILSIAGSDPIGGAGIQADIKTATALGSYAMTVITAVTAQNSRGVAGYEAVSPSLLKLQLDTVLSDLTPDAVKIGMISDVTSADIIADAIERYGLSNVVLDPVMVSTSGHSLSSVTVIDVMRRRLIPSSLIITPNMPEAKEFLGGFTSPEADVRRLAEMFAGTSVLLKGGHCPDAGYTTDYLCLDNKITEFRHTFFRTRNTHGTGCTLSSAIASFLSQGFDLHTSVDCAISWLNGAIEAGAGYSFGSPEGHGPVNHLYKI